MKCYRCPKAAVDAIRTIHLRDFPDHLKSRNSAVPKGKNALLNVIELDVARRGVRSMLPVAREPDATS